MIELKLQLFGGRGSAGGNNPEGAKATITAASKGTTTKSSASTERPIRQGNRADDDVIVSLNSAIRNQNNAEARDVLEDIRTGDKVILYAKTYKGREYTTTITANADNTYNVSMSRKGMKPDVVSNMSAKDTAEEVSRGFMSYTGGTAPKVTIERNYNRQASGYGSRIELMQQMKATQNKMRAISNKESAEYKRLNEEYRKMRKAYKA